MKRKGFTLLELIVSLALSASLLSAVLGLTTLMAKQVEHGKNSEIPDPWISNLEKLIRSDLSHAVSYEQSHSVLKLVGYAAIGAENRQQIQRPARIEYAVQMVDDESWLTRSEFHLDQLNNDRRPPKLVANGIPRFRIRLPGELESEVNLGLVPRDLELVLTLEDSYHTIRYCRP